MDKKTESLRERIEYGLTNHLPDYGMTGEQYKDLVDDLEYVLEEYYKISMKPDYEWSGKGRDLFTTGNTYISSLRNGKRANKWVKLSIKESE